MCIQIDGQDAWNMAQTQQFGGSYSLLTWSPLFAEPCQLAHAGTGHPLSALSKMNTLACLPDRVVFQCRAKYIQSGPP